MVLSVNDDMKNKFQHKGKVGKVVRVAGINGEGGTVSYQAVLQFHPSDPPSKYYTTLLSNLAKRSDTIQSSDGTLRSSSTGSLSADSFEGEVVVAVEESVVAVVVGGGHVGVSVYRSEDSLPPAHHQFFRLPGTYDTDANVLATYSRATRRLVVCATDAAGDAAAGGAAGGAGAGGGGAGAGGGGEGGGGGGGVHSAL